MELQGLSLFRKWLGVGEDQLICCTETLKHWKQALVTYGQGSDSLLQYQLQPSIMYQVTWHILAQAARRPKKKVAPKILRCIDCGELISYSSSKLDKQVLWNRSCSYILQLLIYFIHQYIRLFVLLLLSPINSSTKVVVRFKLFCFLEGCHDCNYWGLELSFSERERKREKACVLLGVVVTVV